VSKRLTLLTWLALTVVAQAQLPVAPQDFSTVNWLFESRAPHDSLKCTVQKTEPFLDFTFRYTAGYFLACGLEQFEPGEDLVSYVRVRPQEGAMVLLGEKLRVAVPPSETASKIDRKKLKRFAIQVSGGFALGEGRYSVEVLLAGQRGRSCYKRWNLKVARKSNEHTLTLALKPHTIAPLEPSSWDGELAGKGRGVRLTVLLHATPMNPYASKLRVWDRAFLLQSLASLLRQTPCESVNIIAFNLDQQQEIFRQDDFDAAGFTQLTQVLRELELGTVSYKALQRQSWHELLVRLVREQVGAEDPSDAVIFLGPTSRFASKVPKDLLKRAEAEGVHFFYFEYFPWRYEFPDAIDYLTRDLEGTVFKIHSAGELGQAIQKMLAQTKPAGSGAGGP